METKLVRVPFDVELAKKITEKSVDGRIVTRDGRSVRLVCFDFRRNGESNYIIGIIDRGNEESTWIFDSKGQVNSSLESKIDLMLEIPGYMTFKDGDVVGFGCGSVGIFKKIDPEGNTFTSYVTLSGNLIIYYEPAWRLSNSHKATEEEKQELIDALKASVEPKAKEYLKRFFGIEEKPKYEFNAGQPVMGMDGRGEWRYDIFSHYKPEYNSGQYVCSARSYSKCLPYNEKTAHLLGTSNNPE